jgi:hypothetical protein
MRNAFIDYFRCPEEFATFEPATDLSAGQGYFRVADAICYGRLSGRIPARHVVDDLKDVSAEISWNSAGLRLPFDLDEVVTNLQMERYRPEATRATQRITNASSTQNAYYLLRPYLPVKIRRQLQKVRLNGWQDIRFPRWPVDFTVDTLMRRSMASMVSQTTSQEVPFVWFWPDGAQSCAVMTHDVETSCGRRFCGELMDLNDSYDVKASFQVIPESRYRPSEDFLADIRERGFEVNVHDLNHDGRLFHSYHLFSQRVARINEYGLKFKSRGFRAGAMYRRQDWFDAFEFSYDMSVPNVAHLEPQRGGCCSVMPFFVGRLLEIPLTTIQDYSLFHVLNDYSIRYWAEQIDLLSARNGLITFITHPDYLKDKRALAVYRELLAHLADVRKGRNIWMALPGEVNDWWRSRRQMSLARHGASWQVEGPGSERARVAYATRRGGRLTYRLETVQ